MIHTGAKDEQWMQLSELIAENMGLHFSQERHEDLKRGVTSAAQELGFEDAEKCLDGLLAQPLTKTRLQVLASHLTVGETYFFRDKQALDALADTILPQLIHARRGRDQRLRIWSAACCSGEEAYSLAILIHQALPDLADWNISITANDINPRALQKAREGIYSEWSFRNAPNWLKKRYFKKTADGRYAINQEIKKLVNFTQLNLVDDAYPSLVTETNAMDIIFCRNVLMYFTPVQISKVIGKLRQSLIDGGWLVVSPSEATKALFPEFTNVNFPGAIFFCKDELKSKEHYLSRPLSSEISAPDGNNPVVESKTVSNSVKAATNPSEDKTSLSEIAGNLQASAESLFMKGLYSEVSDTLLTGFSNYPVERYLNPAVFSLLARALANQGRLDDALMWCERWLAADKLDVTGHYLHGMVLLEQGEFALAQSSLQRATYLDPGFILAHFSLGNLSRSTNKMQEANKHFANALRLLSNRQPEDILPESEGLSAGRLMEFIVSMTSSERAN